MPDNVYEQNWSEQKEEIPVSPHEFCIEGTEWLPKTDWSRDRIIANDD